MVTSRCMNFVFGDKREVKLQDASALPVTEKERMLEGKKLSPVPQNKVTSRLGHFVGGLSIKKAEVYYCR